MRRVRQIDPHHAEAVHGNGIGRPCIMLRIRHRYVITVGKAAVPHADALCLLQLPIPAAINLRSRGTGAASPALLQHQVAVSHKNAAVRIPPHPAGICAA